MIQLLTRCTAEGTKISFSISKFFIKIDSSNPFDMTVAYNENLMTIFGDTGTVTVVRYCNLCEIFNIIFSDANIWSSFSFKMTDQFVSIWKHWLMIGFLWIRWYYNCWIAFCDIICIFRQQCGKPTLNSSCFTINVRELTNTKSSDYNVIVQSPSAKWNYKIKTLYFQVQLAERWTSQEIWMTRWTMV